MVLLVLHVLFVRRGLGGRGRSRRGLGSNRGGLFLFFLFGDDLDGGIDGDRDAYGAAQVHGQGGRQL